MYFALRHVPLFYGPYLIMEVTHSVSETDFTTKFKGTRQRTYSLPKIDSLVASVNKNVLKNFKATQQKTTAIPETDKEKNLEIDPKPTLQATEIACSGLTAFPSLGYVNVKPTQISYNDLADLVKSNTTSKILRAIVYGIAQSSPNNIKAGEIIQTNNSNLYFIKTKKKYKGSMDSKIKNQTCVRLNGNPFPIADFSTFSESTDFVLSYFKTLEPMITELNKINVNTNINQSFGESMAQLVYTAWNTDKAFTGENGTPLTAQQIKDVSLADKASGDFPYYDDYVKIFKESYEKF